MDTRSNNLSLYVMVLLSFLCINCASNKINMSLDSALSNAGSSLAAESVISFSDQYKTRGKNQNFFKENEQKLKQIFKSDGSYKVVINKFSYEGNYPRGFQCFEPLLFVISIGLIPVICNNNINLEIDLVNIKTGEAIKESITYNHKYVAGWVGLFMRVFEDWDYEDDNKLHAIYTIINKISEKN